MKAVSVDEYYEQQAGGLPSFIGSTIQQGAGIGGIFTKFMRGMGPIIKTGAKAAGEQLLNTGMNIASDVIDGKPFADSASSNMKSGGKQILNKLTGAFKNPKRGGAKKRQRKTTGTVKSKRRRVGKDIFS